MSSLVLVWAMLLDAALGEPRWLWSRLPHPAVLMGRAVDWADAKYNAKGEGTRQRGALAILVLCLVAALAGWILSLHWMVELLVAAILLAQRSLVQHVQSVAVALEENLPAARRAVAQIVGRDTKEMDEPSIARAAMESASENLSDGVVAPVFWFLIAGLPGMAVYKMVNTADSMIGYRTPRHEKFGWASARLDDLLNLIPARLTALVIAALGGVLERWSQIAKDARLHRSPNAGWPEAALAQSLDVSLSGPRSYHGKPRDFPWVHASGQREAMASHVEDTVSMLWQVWAVCLACVVLIGLATLALGL
ncbi:MAG: adenosylcobinamide-phosphate synthase CbiB [Pseudomonadota bacterium]